MSRTNDQDPSDQGGTLDELIAAYLAAEDAGESPDRDALLASHPGLADELRSFFREHDRLGRLARPIRDAAAEVTLPHLPAGGADPAPEGPGTRVRYFGDYELQDLLGEGGMGLVYRARQLSLNRPVALKMVRAGLLATGSDLRRFQNEAEAVAELDHPGIVPIYEVGEHEGRRYFTMKLLAGGSLADRLDAYLDDPRAAARLVLGAAEAVDHAHRRGILHRDLKPANILLDERGRPHVADFGLARRLESAAELTHSGAVLGTPAYMAPEQAGGRRGTVTTETDIYGLGAVLYALLTDRPPFRGDSVAETLALVRERPPDRPSKHNPRVPQDLAVICLKCLEKEQRVRYPGARALADDLEAFLADRPVLARPAGTLERSWRWCRRNPTLATLGMLAFAGIVAGAAFSVLYARSRARAAVELTAALDTSEEHRRDAQRLTARAYRRQAFDQLKRDEPGAGLLSMADALAIAPAEDRDLQQLLRKGLAVLAMNFPHTGLPLEPDGPATCVAFSPDGSRLLVGDHKGAVRHYDTTTWRLLRTATTGLGPIDNIAFSTDSLHYATRHGTTIRAWNQSDGNAVGPAFRITDSIN